MSDLNSSDHDLLIELRTIVRGMSTDLKEIKEDHRARLVAVEQNKQDKAASEEAHKTLGDRLSSVEKRQWISMGGAGVIGAAIADAVLLFSGSIHF